MSDKQLYNIAAIQHQIWQAILKEMAIPAEYFEPDDSHRDDIERIRRAQCRRMAEIAQYVITKQAEYYSGDKS